MKKKIIPLVLLGILSLGSLVGCGGNDNPTTDNPITNTLTTNTPTTETPTTPNSTTPAVVRVESVELNADKTTLYIGQTANLTVSILPENAEDKTYSFASSDSDVASVNDNIVTANKIGSAVITVTTNDGNKTDTVNITVTAIPDPTITIDGNKTLTVNAGENLTLPTVSAKDYDNKDLSSYIEIEDLAESGTINNNVFNAKIAGSHEISYYVETDDGRYAEDYLTVDVKPATAESFDVSSYSDPSVITTYGVYKENFEKGRKSPLYAALNDSQNAAYLTSTSDAIQGNSLVINFNKTAGSALNALFLGVFNDYFVREKAVTYKVSFDYKVLSDSVPSDIYFGLSWDGSNGLNNQFVTNKTKDQVNSFSCSFPATKIPAAGNAYFIFFQLSGSTNDSIIAVDNFVFETIECAQVNEVTPTAEQLQAENGFRWDFVDNGASSTNGETIVINNVENETAKDAMKNDTDFGKNALKLTNADDHSFSGLTKNNMIVGKKITIEMKYYAVNGNGFHLIMKGESGNPTLSIDSKHDGNMYVVTYTGTIENGWYQLDIYGQNNPNFEIYIAYINVKLADADPIPENQTPKGHKVGESYTQSSRQWGNEDKTAQNGTKTEAFDNYEDAIANEKMGTKPTKLTSTIGNATHEWYQTGGTALPLEIEQTYSITVVYYVVECSGSFTLNFDNHVFLDLENSIGFHECTISWVAERSVDFFCFFFPENPSTATIYIAYTKVELTAVKGEEEQQTALGFKVGQTWNYDSSMNGYTTKGGLTLSAFDNNTDAIANEKMGSAPHKMTIDGSDSTYEWKQLGNKIIESGHTYEIKVTYYVESWNGSIKWMLRLDGVFKELSTSTGFHEEVITLSNSASVDFMSLYISGGSSATGVIYVAGISITLKAI